MIATSPTALLALDWGTTSARAYRLDGAGGVLDVREAPLGIQQVRDGAFAAALATLLDDWAALAVPRIACGMIGSRQGWVEAAYVECPADLATLAGGLCRTPGGELVIVPGLLYRDATGVPDVIRGEETQIAGAVHPGADRQLLVLPGTHSKWVLVESGRVERFATYMTGETYAVLLKHSILGRMASEAAGSETAFSRGVQRGFEAPGLTHAIFGARTLALTGGLGGGEVADWLSGVLIGHEIATARQGFGTGGGAMQVTVIGSDALSTRYAHALQLAGIDAARGPANAAATGLFNIALRAGVVR